jgi:WD40 repeat protein
MDTGENIMTGEGHKDWLCGVDFHPVGSHLVTSGSDNCIKLWDFVNSSIAHTFENAHTAPIWKAKFHDTGDFVLSGAGDGAIKLWDLHSLKMRQQYRSHTDSVNTLNFQPFTNFFVSGSADSSISIWDMRTGLTVQTFYGHLNAVNDTNFSIGGQYIASCDSDGILKVWDIRMVQEVLTVDTGDVIAHSCAFDKNAKIVAVGCSDDNIRTINIEKGEVVSEMKAHANGVNGVIYN